MSTLDPNVLVALAIAVGPMFGTIGTAILQYFNNKQLRIIANTTSATHTLVNGQGTQMASSIADLSARVASDNPGDENAQIASVTANNNLASKKAADTLSEDVKN